MRLSFIRMHYIGAVICAVSALIITLAVCTYDPHDPSWFFKSSAPYAVQNILGSLGAHLAACLVYVFGAGVFGVCAALCFIAYLIVYEVHWPEELDRCVASALLMVVPAALLASRAFDPLHASNPGGVIGTYIYSRLSIVADPVIVHLLLHILLFVSIVLITRLSWVLMARYVLSVGSFIVNKKTMSFTARVLSAVWHIVSVNIVAGMRAVWHLVSGTQIEKKGLIVPLEFEAVVREVLHDTSDDTFWRSAYGDRLPEQELQEPAHFSPTMIQEITAQKPHQTMSQERCAVSTYRLPNPASFTAGPKEVASADDKQFYEQRARILEEKLARFGITGSVVSIKTGPVITLFEYQPDIDSKVSKIIALEDDLALALEAISIRIIAPIPGRSVVGFEVANKKRAMVHFQPIVTSKAYRTEGGHLPLVLGSDIVGNPVIVDLTAMPHLLVAGSTGSGKSVALNAMLMSLLYRCTPDQLQLILIDPKRLEFAAYADIGHLVFPIVTNPKDAGPILQWVVKTMEERYETMASVGARNLFDYHTICAHRDDLESMPFMVVMIDELSDLMMTTGKEIEALIARIAQMARAAGIHMIVATQRPSVDVITGLIKVNFPSRISFRVTSKVDSRTILDCVGAEKLLGKGDMLFLSTSSALGRVHGAYVSHAQVTHLVEYIKRQRPAQYLDIREVVPDKNALLHDQDDQLYQEVLDFIETTDKISISLLQRRFRIGYNRSARIMEQLEAAGLIMPSDGSKMRKVIR